MIVVKVGGSLFDHPRLGAGLRAYLDSLAPAKVLLVPGGGGVVDAVRKRDAIHGLGEEASHWLALRGMDAMGEFVARLLGEPRGEAEKSPWVAGDHGDKPRGSLVEVLDCFAFAVEDEARPGALPHSWDVTSDSIAARVAVVHGAERLVLLKSVDVPPGMSWEDAATRGLVDAHFPRVVAGATFPIEVVNFRRVLDSLGV